LDVEFLSGSARFRDRAKIRIIGSKKDVELAEKAVKAISGIDTMAEPEARLKIQEVMDNQSLKADILFDGNGVTSLTRIIRNLNQIIEHGTLYDRNRPRLIPIGSMLRMPSVGDCILSDYFYEFLHLDCGSIAHYNKQGWVCEYPTLDDLKAFFKKNEYGERVLDDIPEWKIDAKRIVVAIEAKLFPFESYMKKKQKVILNEQKINP
jgi:hypothetical protein